MVCSPLVASVTPVSPSLAAGASSWASVTGMATELPTIYLELNRLRIDATAGGLFGVGGAEKRAEGEVASGFPTTIRSINVCPDPENHHSWGRGWMGIEKTKHVWRRVKKNS